MIVKPDAVAKNAIGQIIARVEGEGFVVRALRMVELSAEQARAFYAVHRERPFYGELVEFMTSGPAVPMVLERADAVRICAISSVRPTAQRPRQARFAATLARTCSATPSMPRTQRPTPSPRSRFSLPTEQSHERLAST